MNKRLAIKEILKKKKTQEKIVMLTAYDYPLACLIDQVDVDIILVGDSLANVVLGLSSTREVSMEEMIHHTKAVNRAVTKSFLVGDMPYDSYQTQPNQAVKNARRFIKEGGCQAVKLEWFDRCLEVTQKIVKAGIPVMGHLGLTPQTADNLGGFKVQGKDAESARRMIQNAKALEKAGCFSIVLECVPDKIAQMITEELKIPTIGIGAGVHCDGQVLVTYDILGLSFHYHPKFVKQYTDLKTPILKAVERYKKDVRAGRFPSKKYSFGMKREEWMKLKGIKK